MNKKINKRNFILNLLIIYGLISYLIAIVIVNLTNEIYVYAGGTIGLYEKL